MKFYVSWYPGDPWYPDYDPNCHVLVSVSSVSQFWKLGKYKRLPKSIILDSGGYRYAKNPNERLIPRDVLVKQLKMLGSSGVKAFVCALDYPILDPSMPSNEKDRCISQTLAYAYEMKAHLEKLRIQETIRPMAIIQGYDEGSLQYCTHEVKNIGFQNFGLGSLLAAMNNQKELLGRVKTVVNEIGGGLHVFGISNVSTLKILNGTGVSSVDSARPAKAAMYNQILVCVDGQIEIVENHSRIYPHIHIPHELQGYQCDCPVCDGEISWEVRKIGKKKYIALRTLHNYWTLKRAIEAC